jgi:hypothetical protein
MIKIIKLQKILQSQTTIIQFINVTIKLMQQSISQTALLQFYLPLLLL